MTTLESRITAELDVRRVLNRYCYAIDQRDFEAVHSCYHPDATDDHQVFTGTARDFVAFAESFLRQFTSTFHFLGNVLIDVDADDHAVADSYVIAYHRLALQGDRPARDHIVGARYVDAFERRNGTWKISSRTVTLEWTRTDAVPPGWTIPGRS